jgi:uncharacterized protein YbbC (DUF1343 family)
VALLKGDTMTIDTERRVRLTRTAADAKTASIRGHHSELVTHTKSVPHLVQEIIELLDEVQEMDLAIQRVKRVLADAVANKPSSRSPLHVISHYDGMRTLAERVLATIDEPGPKGAS